jgi:hypothetical protein
VLSISLSCYRYRYISFPANYCSYTHFVKIQKNPWPRRRHHHHHHHRISIMELSHLFTRSGLTHPEVSSRVCHDSFCQLENSVSLPRVIYYEAFYLHVVSSFSCIPVLCLKLVLFLIPLQFVYLFCNLSFHPLRSDVSICTHFHPPHL